MEQREGWLCGHTQRSLVGGEGLGGEHSGGARSWMGGAFAPPPPLGLSWEGKVGPRAWGPQPPPETCCPVAPVIKQLSN